MSDMWDRASSGDWDKRDDNGLEKGDGASWVHGQKSDENAKPKFDNDNNCRICGANDHFARNCPNAESEGGPQPDCYRCGKPGHIKADCPEGGNLMGACFNCGEEGHSKVDCPQPRKFTGACFNCGGEGHSKADCPNPKVFTGACHFCSQEGHPASACPEKGPIVCKNCMKEGHTVKDCKDNRVFDLNHVPDMLPNEAWAMMQTASDEKDIQQFREALQAYSKAVPEATYQQIAKKMLEEDFNVFLIGLEKINDDVAISLIDLQGQLDRDYAVGFFFANKPPRRSLKNRWPENDDDNLERLANAGLPYDRLIVKCRNCEELGHVAKNCPQEAREVEKVEIKCNNCNEVGHRVRDCPEQRKSKYGCRNCGIDGHVARDCPEPRSAAGVECRKCGETGHFAKDCPQGDGGGPRTCRNCGSVDHLARDCDKPRDPSTMQCRNCDQMGHAARDCPEPKDWSKVQCNRCGEMGHTVRRCPQPEGSGENEYGSGGIASGFGGDNDAAGFGGGFGHEDTQQNQSTYFDTDQVADQLAQLNTVEASDEPQW